MVSATIMWLRKNGFEKVALMQHAEVTSLRFSSSPDEIIPIWEFMPPQPKISAFDVIGGMQNYDYFFVLGADVLDGYYSDIESYHRLLLAQTAAQCGFRVTLLGFSYNATPAPLALQAMRQLRPPVRICPRDPVSYERLTRLIQSPPIQVADVAFLLEPMEPADQAVTCWLEDQRKRGVPLIGINAILTSRFFADRSAQSLDSYLSFYQDLIREISDRFTESRFLFIPHDYRPNGVGEGPVLEQIYQSLDDDLQRRVLKLEGHYTASEIKWIVSQLDFVVSSRMHLAIAAIGQGVPTFCFEYQGKFRGLFEAIEQNQLLSSISEILDTPGEVKNRVINCIQNRDALKNQISAKLPDLMKLAERNFDF